MDLYEVIAGIVLGVLLLLMVIVGFALGGI
jgi:hypothetical protein